MECAPDKLGQRIKYCIDVLLSKTQQHSPVHMAMHTRVDVGQHGVIPMSVPLFNPRFKLACSIWAACIGLSTRAGALQPLLGEKKAGKSSVPYAATQTPCRAKGSITASRHMNFDVTGSTTLCCSKHNHLTHWHTAMCVRAVRALDGLHEYLSEVQEG